MTSGQTACPAQPLTLRTLTFNIWGVPFFSKDREERIKAIARRLGTMELDVCGLQEAWLEEDRRRLVEGAARGGLVYSHYFPAGIFGSGLLLLSRYPLVDAAFHRFRLTSRPEKFPREQEYFAGKGIGFARMQTPAGPVDLYNVHPIAQYGPDNEDHYQAHRSAAAYEIARFIFTQSPPDRPVILFGDMNMRPDQFGYRALLTLAGLRDVYAETHQGEHPVTYAQENPYAKYAIFSKQLDYILVRDGINQGLRAKRVEVAFDDLNVNATCLSHIEKISVQER